MQRFVAIFMALAAFAAGAMTLSREGEDQVLLVIDGQPTTLAQFRYYYNKNCKTDSGILSPEEYLDYFINYRLKVIDAEHEKRDTTLSFRKEYEAYRNELIAPFLIDSVLLDQMVAEAFSHTKEDINVSHIMVGTSPEEFNKLEKILSDLRDNSCDFDEIAANLSIDPSAKYNHGHLGWISAGRYPYSFEEVAYTTPVWAYSEPFHTDFGSHIIRVNDRRPAKGEVHVRHILLSTQSEDNASGRIDSIYNLLISGADFSELARKFSDDRKSAAVGGDLGWFPSGVMVMPFDSIAFAIADMEISRPFATRFGYHIIQKLGHRNNLSIDTVRHSIEAAIRSDSRLNTLRESRLRSLRDTYQDNVASDSLILERYISDLISTNRDLSLKLDEYRDGILLFNISSDKVWNKASADSVALNQYFLQHRESYNWNSPRYRTLLIYTTDQADSLLASNVLASVSEEMTDADVARTLRKSLSNRVRIEKVFAASGENKIIDFLAFGGDKPSLTGHWNIVMPFRGKLLDSPESLADVKGLVLADMQDELERDWLNALKKKYKVKINRKLLKNI